VYMEQSPGYVVQEKNTVCQSQAESTGVV